MYIYIMGRDWVKIAQTHKMNFKKDATALQKEKDKTGWT